MASVSTKKARSGKNSESSISEPQPEGEKTEKQIKIDSMLPSSQQIGEKESSIQDVISVVKALEKKVNKLASEEYIDKRLEKLVTIEFVDKGFNALRESFTKEIKSELDKVYDQLRQVKTKIMEIESLKTELSDSNIKLEKTLESNAEIIAENKALKDMLKDRDVWLKDHESKINNLEQYTRNNSVRIYGITDSDKNESAETSRDHVIKMVNEKLKMIPKITPADIDIAHRIGQYKSDGNRPVICKFVSKALKKRVIKLRRQLKGSPLVVREDLTTKHAKLLENVSSKPEVDSAWTDKGRVIALLIDGRKMSFDIHSDLSKDLIPADRLQALQDARKVKSVRL